MASKFSEILVSALVGPIEAVATDQLADLLRKIKPIEAQKTVLLSIYPAVDVQLEDLSSKSKSKIDDAVVHAIKGAIEIVADEIGLELPNNDND